jgi:hypothetical protein
MPHRLPRWLNHYLHVPAWAMVRVAKDATILWVNERLAEDNRHHRRWFVGRKSTELWPDSVGWRHLDFQAMEEKRPIDTVVDGRDLLGVPRWLDVRRTPIDDERLLLVFEDVSCRIRLAGLRLTLGERLAGESKTRLDQSFARQLLRGASLDELCQEQNKGRTEILAKLSLLVAEASHPKKTEVGSPLPPSAPSGDVPAWLQHYEDLPHPAALLEYPSLRVLWVNRRILENNRVSSSAVVGRSVDGIWSGARNWEPFDDEAMAEQRPFESVDAGRNLSGEQGWAAVRRIPVGPDRILVLGEDVTAQLRLHALRLLLNLQPRNKDTQPQISNAFAKLLLDGASVANLCAALEMPQSEVLQRLAEILDHLG